MLKFWKRSEAPDDSAPPAALPIGAAETSVQPPRRSWVDRLKSGLAKTGSGISGLFLATKVDEALFEELGTRS